MIKRYLVFYLLIISLVHANAQSYYLRDKKVSLTQNVDQIIIRINDVASKNLLMDQIKKDQNFELMLPASYKDFDGKFYIIRKKVGVSVNNNDALNYYLSQPYVVSASFLYYSGNDFYGTTNAVIVKPKGNLTADDLRNKLSIFNVSDITQDNFPPGLYVVKFPKSSSQNILALSCSLYETGYFDFAEPDFVYKWQPDRCYVDFSDPLWEKQWNLSDPDNGIDPNCAWTKTFYCSEVRVAVLDIGVDLTHPDLQTMATGFDATGGGSMGAMTPFTTNDEHGTACAGIIGARANTIGIVGVAPNVTIVPVRISTGVISVADAIAGVTWAYNNADVLSCSWHLPAYSSGLDFAIFLATNVYGRGGQGCPTIFSTGNTNSSSIFFPASSNWVIAVGASSPCNERKSPTSCDGELWGSNFGTGLSVVAPGVKIPTTDIQSTDGAITSSGTAGDYIPDFGGTSAAVPHVAGVAAMLLCVNPCLTQPEVKDVIELSASKVGGYSYSTPTPNGLWNNEMGYGRLNASNAVALVYDIYKQNLVEPLGWLKIYKSPHKVFSGYHVTGILPDGNYIVPATTNITFKAAEAVDLEPGFYAQYNAVFLAEIDNTPCIRAGSHYKVAGNSNSGNTSTVNTKEPIVINVYPNPVHEKLNVSLTLGKDANVSFSISNMLGQSLYNTTISIDQGSQIQTITTDMLVPGLYMLTVKVEDVVKQFKFVKQ